MRDVDIVVVGAGPAGLAAAAACGRAGAETLIVDFMKNPGGQLIKQTHKFFGSERQYAGVRGVQIPRIFLEQLSSMPNVTVMWEMNASGYYEDGTLALENQHNFYKVKPKRLIIATGAGEKSLAFENNDLPGVYGAGAVQTLMNVHGVEPGKRVLMVGSGNIGLIVSYQLRQAGVQVVALVEAAPKIGGYLVHAAKLRRAGVPILTRHTIRRAVGKEAVEGADVAQVDEAWKPIPGTERRIDCDVICLAVGLTPLADVLWQAGCEMVYVPALGGHVPVRDHSMRTSNPGVFVAGDAGGVEEASSAMISGEIAGISAAASIGMMPEGAQKRLNQLVADLAAIRSGPTGEKICYGISCATVKGGAW